MKLTFLLILLLLCIHVQSQEDIPDLITDRPDQTESASVVPLNSLQIETGFLLENNNSNEEKLRSYNFSTTLLRYGLFERFELRLGLAYLSEQRKIENTDEKEKINGLSPLYTGFKVLIVEEKGCLPQIAFLGGLVFPFSANDEFKAPYTAPVMRFAFAHTLSDKFSLGYNVGAEWNGENAIPDYYYSVTLGMSVTKKIGAFIENFGFLPEEVGASHLMDAGITFLVLHNLQLDLSGGIGLNNTATDSFIGFGLSYRIPR